MMYASLYALLDIRVKNWLLAILNIKNTGGIVTASITHTLTGNIVQLAWMIFHWIISISLFEDLMILKNEDFIVYNMFQCLLPLKCTIISVELNKIWSYSHKSFYFIFCYLLFFSVQLWSIKCAFKRKLF